MALPSVASLALPRPELPKAVLARPRRLTAAPPPEGWLVLYPAPLRSKPVYACDLCHAAAPTPRSAGRPPGPSPPRLRLLTASGVRPEAWASGPARVRRRPRAVRPALDRASWARRPSVSLHPRHADVAPVGALAAPCGALLLWYWRR